MAPMKWQKFPIPSAAAICWRSLVGTRPRVNEWTWLPLCLRLRRLSSLWSTLLQTRELIGHLNLIRASPFI